MPLTEADVDSLKAAFIARQGTRQITFGDQSATFDSVGDMLKLFQWAAGEVAVTSGTSRTRLAATSKGV